MYTHVRAFDHIEFYANSMSLLESVMDMKYSNLYRSCATKMTSTLVNGSFEMPQIPLTVLLLAAQWGQSLKVVF